MMAELLPFCSSVVFTQPAQDRVASVETLKEMAEGYDVKVFTVRRVGSACAKAIKEAGRNGTVCVAGSIFTVGEAMKYLDRKS